MKTRKQLMRRMLLTMLVSLSCFFLMPMVAGAQSLAVSQVEVYSVEAFSDQGDESVDAELSSDDAYSEGEEVRFKPIVLALLVFAVIAATVCFTLLYTMLPISKKRKK